MSYSGLAGHPSLLPSIWDSPASLRYYTCFPRSPLQRGPHRGAHLFSSSLFCFPRERFEASFSQAPLTFRILKFTDSLIAEEQRGASLLFSDTWKYHRSTVLWRRNSSWMPPAVKNGEGGGKQSTEEQMLDEEALQSELESAVDDEDYARAAKLRNSLRVLHEDSKASVLSANARFYHAFRNGDLAAMISLWAKEDYVYVVHPGAGRISGYELVTDSWEVVCGSDHEFPLQIDLKDVEVHVRGNLGYVTCMEVVKNRGTGWGKQIATNVFERKDGQWFMCIHHASHIED